MKPAVALVLALPVLLSAPATEDALVFAIADASKLRKSFDSSMELELDEVRMTLGDQELPEEMTEAFAISYKNVSVCVVLDEYRAVGNGRPGELVRRFETLEQSEVNHRAMPGTEPVDEDETKESELVGHEVRFAWDGESESYGVSWVGEAGDDELLVGLEEDMDLRALLPPGSVSVDDTWELSGKTLLEAMPPGGRLGFEKEEEDEFDFEDSFEGSAQATYAETREEEGIELAVIAIHLEGAAELPEREANGGIQTYALALELEYELLWNLEEGRAHSLEVIGGVGAAIVVTQEVEVNGQTHVLEVEMELSGEVEMSATFERQ